MPTISKDSVSFIQIGSEEAGQRLDHFLGRLLKGVPKSHIQRIIRAGEVRVNKKRCKAETRLEAGDTLRIPPVRVAAPSTQGTLKAPPAAAVAALQIVYEDEVLLVVDKPSGMAVHGGSGLSFGVIEYLRRQRPEARYLELVHRLDKDTSGLLMVAKKRSALVHLHTQLRDNHPRKVYLALGVGMWPQGVGQVRLPLVKYQGAQGEKMVRVAVGDVQGQFAHTVFHEVARFSGSLVHSVGLAGLSLMEATLKTGRTHQIRVHMQAQGCPIAGDERYGDYEANRRLSKLGLKRMFLHASELEIIHPVSGEPLCLHAPLPKELQDFVSTLQGSAAQCG